MTEIKGACLRSLWCKYQSYSEFSFLTERSLLVVFHYLIHEEVWLREDEIYFGRENTVIAKSYQCYKIKILPAQQTSKCLITTEHLEIAINVKGIRIFKKGQPTTWINVQIKGTSSRDISSSKGHYQGTNHHQRDISRDKSSSKGHYQGPNLYICAGHFLELGCPSGWGRIGQHFFPKQFYNLMPVLVIYIILRFELTTNILDICQAFGMNTKKLFKDQ